jgi:hypothetical protein
MKRNPKQMMSQLQGCMDQRMMQQLGEYPTEERSITTVAHINHPGPTVGLRVCRRRARKPDDDDEGDEQARTR